MKVTVYSAKDFEIPYLEKANTGHELNLNTKALSLETVHYAKGSDAIAIFAGDDASEKVLDKLKEYKVDFIAIRAAGYDNVNISHAKKLGIKIAHVPAYSPYAIAEHSVALMLALNRKLIQANRQVNSHDFRLNKLIGFDMNGKTVGVIGTGRIGSIVIKILQGFGCKILAYDVVKNDNLLNKGVEYTDIRTLCMNSNIITIHTPLNEGTKYLIDKEKIYLMKKGVMLINTSRGAVIKTEDVIEGIEKEIIGFLGIDVYEKEKGLFFYDHSDDILKDAIFSRLLTFKNVLITGHQAFLTNEALQNIADTTISNLDCRNKNVPCENEL